ncbi:MAG: rod-binding protein [Spirochaetales bacterium]|uniref:Rod-binding protein n=1 Tax=Candidatus Thalassospirochaeta sargassi TaxID=3119039 RepID=A0AAJ1MKK6_9SPIO|nr:rod-binding protein [Spirochaetales bacterium]
MLNSTLSNAKSGRMSELDQTKLKEACQDFEALFIKQMLDTMRQTVSKSGMLDGGMAEDVFEDMLYDEYAQSMAKTGNFGIAKMMYSEMSGLL